MCRRQRCTAVPVQSSAFQIQIQVRINHIIYSETLYTALSQAFSFSEVPFDFEYGYHVARITIGLDMTRQLGPPYEFARLPTAAMAPYICRQSSYNIRRKFLAERTRK